MEAFRKLTATAAPIQIANIDTDQIIPARFLKTPRSTDHGQFLFHDMRRGRTKLERRLHTEIKKNSKRLAFWSQTIILAVAPQESPLYMHFMMQV
ncbi:MAG: hypothetical protein CM15mP62_13820 [Rhodospirillaceae bacterium]|nr:MAG: hypothetical protein CM15mP62_13820 [Rhodospirillaceae bacterium]